MSLQYFYHRPLIILDTPCTSLQPIQGVAKAASCSRSTIVGVYTDCCELFQRKQWFKHEALSDWIIAQMDCIKTEETTKCQSFKPTQSHTVDRAKVDAAMGCHFIPNEIFNWILLVQKHHLEPKHHLQTKNGDLYRKRWCIYTRVSWTSLTHWR